MLYPNRCTDYSVRSLLFIIEIILGIILLYYEWFQTHNNFSSYISTGWFSLIAIYQLVFIRLTLKSLGNIQFDLTIGTNVLIAEIIWYVIGIFYSAIYLDTEKNSFYLFILIMSILNIFYYLTIDFFNKCLCCCIESTNEEFELEDANILNHEGLIENNISQYEVIPIAEEINEE